MKYEVLNGKGKFSLNGITFIIVCQVSEEDPKTFFISLKREEADSVSQIKLTLSQNEDGKVIFVCQDQDFDSNDDSLSIDVVKKIGIQYIRKKFGVFKKLFPKKDQPQKSTDN